MRNTKFLNFIIDSFDKLIVSHGEKISLKFFESNGNFISSFVSEGNNLNQFYNPMGISFGNKEENSLLICDSSDHKIKIINLD